MDTTVDNLSGKLLIAAPGLNDPHFSRTVILICEHTKDGAFGLIINKVLMNSFRPLLDSFDIKGSVIDLPVYYGGPVKPEQGYVLYSPIYERYVSLKISEKIALTASREILQDIAKGKGPRNFMFSLGFAGWDANQLEEEIMFDSWIIAPFETSIIFSTPVNERWACAARTAGIDFDRFVSWSGNA
jgi:putative transcriptional regulator